METTNTFEIALSMIVQKHRHNLEKARLVKAAKKPENIAAQYLDAEKYLLKLMDLAVRKHPKLTVRQKADFAQILSEALDNENKNTMGNPDGVPGILDAEARAKILGGRADIPDQSKHAIPRRGNESAGGH